MRTGSHAMPFAASSATASATLSTRKARWRRPAASGYDSRAGGGHEKWWDGRYDESARFAGVEGTDPVHVVHLVSATDKTFD